MDPVRNGARRAHSIAGVAGAIVAAPVAAATIAVAALTGYLGVLTVAGTRRERRRRAAGSPTTTGAVRRYAIMVPAHDEAAGIATSVRSMVDQDHPTFEVHVVADNCTDDTASVARAAGATVHERVDPDDRGKGAALNWLHGRLHSAPQPFDAYVIVDADSTLEPGFLSAIDRAFDGGASVVQGFYGVRDPDASPSTALRYAALACRHHLRPLGRTALGASCGLFGNGMAFRADVLADRRWSGHLTEDIEFQMELLMDGTLVDYAPDARLEAEMPGGLDASTTQNQRWELGRIQVAKRFVPLLVRRLGRGPMRQRVAAADALADQLVPPLSVLAVGQLAVDALAIAVAVAHPTRSTKLVAATAVASTAVLVGHVLAGLRAVQAPASIYRSFAQAPKLIVWKVRLWLGVLRGRDEVTWTRTARNDDQDATT